MFYNSFKFRYNKHGDATAGIAGISETDWLLVVYGTESISIMGIGKGNFFCVVFSFLRSGNSKS